MMRWKILQTLTNPKDSAWDNLLAQTFDSEVHADRKMGFLLSRDALKQCLLDFGHDLSIPELKLENHSLLPSLPQFTISLSHSKDCAVALVAERKVFSSVGIDIEHKERLVKDMIIERISHSHDKKLRNIEIWCLKEAVFKALMNTGKFEKIIDFSSIQLLTHEWNHPDSGLWGEWEINQSGPYIVAKAFIKN